MNKHRHRHRHRHRHGHKHGHKHDHEHSHKHDHEHSHKNDNFEIVYKDCGTGRTKVSVVKRKSDKKLLIWKRARYHGSRSRDFYKSDIEKSKMWRKFGISRVKVCAHPDKKSALKTYIKGYTLGQILKKNPIFFSGNETKCRKALIELIKLLIDSKHYIHDIKGANLVFDGDRWQVIDSGKAYKQKNRSETAKEYRKNLEEKWSRSLSSHDEIYHLKLFLDKYCQ